MSASAGRPDADVHVLASEQPCQGVRGIDNLRKIIIKYYLEEYFGIDIQMKVLDFEF